MFLIVEKHEQELVQMPFFAWRHSEKNGVQSRVKMTGQVCHCLRCRDYDAMTCPDLYRLLKGLC